MAHFAKINDSNIVTELVVIDDKDTQDGDGKEDESVGAKYLSDAFGGTWKQTSYNTVGGVHALGGTPFRKNFAAIGYTYDSAKNAFITPKPYASWTLDEDTCQWKAPKDYPTDGNAYDWNETTKRWNKSS